MPNKPKTPTRNLRVPDELWQAAKAQATQENTTVTAAVVAFLEQWTGHKLAS